MKKKNAMKKCTVLHGDVVNLNQQFVEKYKSTLIDLKVEWDNSVAALLNQCAKHGEADMYKLKNDIGVVDARYEKKIKKYEERIEKWKKADPRYSIKLAPIVKKSGSNS